MNITPEQIRDLAVKAVEEFINKKVPLSVTISNLAIDMELNPEQIKRLIEATNTICQLKLISMAEDRTFEFPVASYEDVLSAMTIPEHLKEAQINVSKEEILPSGGSYLITRKVAPTLPAEPVERHFTPGPTGSSLSQITDLRVESIQIPRIVEPTPEGGELEESTMGLGVTDHEKKAYLMKQYISNKSELEKIAMAKEEMFAKINEAVHALKVEPHALEKLAMVTDTQTFTKMAKLVGQNNENLETGLIFTNEELQKAASLCVLYKQAKDLVSEEEERLKLEKRAASVLGALVGTPSRLAGNLVGGAAGTAVGAVAKTVSKGIIPAAKKIGIGGAISHAMNIGGALSYQPKTDVWQALHN